MVDPSAIQDTADVTEAPRATTSQGSLDVAALVAAYHAELYRYAYRLTGSQPDAEDLTQHVFLMAHSRGEQLRDVGSIRNWLFAILRNSYLKLVRRHTPLPAASIELDIDSLPAPQTTVEIDRERLQAALDELPDEFKIVVLMFYFEGCSYRQIAQQLGVPDGTVMSRLSRAKSHLRKKLSPSSRNE
jgi:RNA polymerase sigma-70 factor (ECF subfamily)